MKMYLDKLDSYGTCVASELESGFQSLNNFICGASSRKPYNVGENIFFFLADLNSPDYKL